MSRKVFGWVRGASTSEGIVIDLSPEARLEQVEKDRMIVVEGGEKLYLGVVLDIGYSVPESHMKIYRILEGSTLQEPYMEYIREEVASPSLAVIPLAEYDEALGEASKFTSIPQHGSVVPMEQAPLARKFIPEADFERYFPIGMLDLVTGEEVIVADDIYDLHQLSFGIFGKAGTGKTYLANLLILNAYVHGFLHPEEKLTLLVFDVQGEYSHYLLDDRHQKVCQGASARMKLVNGKKYVYIYCVDEDEYRKVGGDGLLRIPLYDVSVETLATILEPLSPTDVSIHNLEIYRAKVLEAIDDVNSERQSSGLPDLLIKPEHWALTLLYFSKNSAESLARLLLRHNLIDLPRNASPDELAEDMVELMLTLEDKLSDRNTMGLRQSIGALKRRIYNLRGLPISFKWADAKLYDDIVELLVDRGEHVTIDLGGRYSRNVVVYMSIANILAKKIMERIDELMATPQKPSGMYHKLVIYLEEAHRFLEKNKSTVFGRLAREYRKYGVIVVPIDQKPGDLDSDVISMLWAMFIFQLTDDSDIEAVISGLENKRMFRELIAKLGRGRAVYHNIRSVFPMVLKTINICEDTVRPPGSDRDMKIYKAMEWVIKQKKGDERRFVVDDV